MKKQAALQQVLLYRAMDPFLFQSAQVSKKQRGHARTWPLAISLSTL